MADTINDLVTSLISNPSSLFEVSNEDDINKRYELLSTNKLEIVGNILDLAVAKTDFTKNPAKSFIGKILLKNIAGDVDIANKLGQNIDLILTSAKKVKKSDDIINNLLNDGIFNKNSSKYMMGNVTNIDMILTPILRHANANKIEKICKNIKDEDLLKCYYRSIYFPSEYEKKPEMYENIIRTGLLDNIIVNHLRGLGTDVGIKSFFEALKRDEMSSKQINEIITKKLRSDELKDFISSNQESIAENLDKFPSESINSMLKANPDLLKTSIETLGTEKLAEIIGKLPSDKLIKDTLDQITPSNKKKIIEQLKNNPSNEAVQKSIEDINKEISNIKDSYGKISGNIVKNRLDVIQKAYNKIAIRVLEFRRKITEKMTARISEMHNPSDRFGIINSAKLLLFLNSEKRYVELTEKINKREENINQFDKNIEEREKDNLEAQSIIEEAKRKMKKTGEVAKKRLDNTDEIRRLKRIISEGTPKKEDKFGKHTLKEEYVEQAWDVLFNNDRLNIEDITIVKITQKINEQHSELAGKINMKQLSILLEEIKRRELAKAAAESLDPASRSIGGMSNYILIIAITTITITGLIILLTMILS